MDNNNNNRKYKVLIIEDEEAIVRGLSRSLKIDGYDVVSAYNGEEGLKVFQREDPEIILTDIKMPGMDGLEVLKKVKEINPETEVIIITGHGDMESSIEALQYDASDFINKPVTEDSLSIALRRAEEKIEMRKKLEEYTTDLENKIQIATKELRRKSSFQSKLIRSSNDGIVATDKDLNIVIFNPEAARIFGYSQSEVYNRMKIDDLYPPEVAEVFRRKMLGSDNSEELFWKEIAVTSKNKESIPVRFSGSILHEKGEVMGSVAFIQDLRQIKHLEKELIQSERLAAIGQTVASLAHSIKNILYGLRGGSYIVDTSLDRNDLQKLSQGWEIVKRNIERVSSLVTDLLTYSKEREPEYQRCSPNEIAKEVIELFRETAKQNGIEIAEELDQAIPDVSMDPQTIYRCLSNLFSNAVDACVFDENKEKTHRVSLKTFLENGYIRFEVQDNGCGMDEKVRESLFDSFYSTKGGKGTGLGLLVTKKLVEEHKGKIEVESVFGKGSNFIIRLPYVEAYNSHDSAKNKGGNIHEY